MFNFLHTFNPDPVLISVGPFSVHWYGLFIVSGILAATVVAFKLGEKYGLKKDTIIDTIFYLVIGGIAGARLYHIGLEFSYYSKNPLNIFKLWQGGLAIHGGIIAGVIVLYMLAKKYKIRLWQLAAIFAPGLALAQAIGRWGNYFNQEIYGLPTTLPWGIPIEPTNRIAEYFTFEYFHPTFLYESIGNFLIFLILISIHAYIIKNKKFHDYFYFSVIASYLILYSLLRFSLEFIRVDRTPEILGLRWPQIASLVIIIMTIIFLTIKNKTKKMSS